MSKERWDVKKYVDEWPEFEPSPDNSQTLLDDPHLKAVYQLATAASLQQEGVWDLTWGLMAAVSGVGTRHAEDLYLSSEYAPGSYSAWIEGYALGLQMRLAVGVPLSTEDLEPLTGLNCDDYDVSTSDISEWLQKWRKASGNKERELRLLVAAVNPASELFGPVRITATPKQLETLFGFPPNGEDDPHKVDRCWWVKKSDGSDAANIYAYKQKNAAETDELSWSIQGTSEEYVDALHESIQEQVASLKVSEDV